MADSFSFDEANTPSANTPSASEGFSFDDANRKPSGFLRRAVADPALALAKGAIGVPEAAVGVADLVTGGQAGKLAEAAGFRPKEAKQVLSDLQSPELNANREAVGKAEGFIPTVIEAAQRPSVVADAAIESVPGMLAGGVVGRGFQAGRAALGLATRYTGAELAAMTPAARLAAEAAMGKEATTAGAVGEGVLTAGQNTEQVRQEDPNGEITGTQAGIMAASGALTGAISRVSGGVANRLGIGDADTALVRGKLGPATGEVAAAGGKPKGVARKIAEGFITEGALEEAPQSYQEQVAQNLAQGKPWDEGAGNAAGLGFLTGGATGAVVAPLHGSDHANQTPPAAPAAAPQSGTPLLPAPGQYPQGATLVVDPEGNVMDAAQADLQQRPQNRPIAETGAMGQGRNGDVVDVTPKVGQGDLFGQTQPLPTNGDSYEATQPVNFGDTQPLPVTPSSFERTQPVPEAARMGIDPQAGPLQAAANVAIGSGAHQQGRDAGPVEGSFGSSHDAERALADSGKPGRVVRSGGGWGIQSDQVDAGAKAPLTTMQGSGPTARAVEAAKPVQQAQQPQESGLRPFPPAAGSLGVPRAEMPQITPTTHGPLTQFLAARGITHDPVEVDPRQLKPTQAEYDPAKVKAQREADASRTVLTSSDGYILDGHHQWLSRYAAGEPIKAIRFNAPMSDLLPLAKEFPSATTAPASDAAAPAAGRDATAAQAPAPDAAPAPAAAAGGPEQSAGGSESGPAGHDAGSEPPARVAPDRQKAKADLDAALADLGQLAGKTAEPAAPKSLSIGRTPSSAVPVTVRDGIVHLGEHPALDFDSGEPVRVKEGATDADVREALKAGGVLSTRQRIFGGEAAAPSEERQGSTEPPAQAPTAPADPLAARWAEMGGAARQYDLTRSKAATTLETAQGLETKDWGDLSDKMRSALEAHWNAQGKEGAPAAEIPDLIGKGGKLLSEGGAPFQNKLQAERHRIQHAPQGRVVKSGDGFAVKMPTTRELEARQKAGERLRAAGDRAKANKNPLLHWLGEQGGLNPAMRGDLSPDRNPFVKGGVLFRAGGENLDTLAERAAADGFLPAGSEDANRLYDLVAKALRGDRVGPVYAEGGAQAELEQRMGQMRDEAPPLDEAFSEPLPEHLEGEADALAGSISDELAAELDALIEQNENASPEAVMRGLGFTDEEIDHELTAQRPDEAPATGEGSGARGEAQSQGPPESGEAGAGDEGGGEAPAVKRPAYDADRSRRETQAKLDAGQWADEDSTTYRDEYRWSDNDASPAKVGDGRRFMIDTAKGRVQINLTFPQDRKIGKGGSLTVPFGSAAYGDSISETGFRSLLNGWDVESAMKEPLAAATAIAEDLQAAVDQAKATNARRKPKTEGEATPKKPSLADKVRAAAEKKGRKVAKPAAPALEVTPVAERRDADLAAWETTQADPTPDEWAAAADAVKPGMFVNTPYGSAAALQITNVFPPSAENDGTTIATKIIGRPRNQGGSHSVFLRDGKLFTADGFGERQEWKRVYVMDAPLPTEQELREARGSIDKPSLADKARETAQKNGKPVAAQKAKRANDGKAHPTVMAADQLGEEFGMEPEAAPSERLGSKKAGKGFGSWKIERDGVRISISAGSPGMPSEKITLMRHERGAGSENVNRSPEEARAKLVEWLGDPSLEQLQAPGAVATDLLGTAPSTGQQDAERARQQKAQKDRAQQQSAPGAEEFQLGMVDARNGKEVDPGQQDLLSSAPAAAPSEPVQVHGQEAGFDPVAVMLAITEPSMATVRAKDPQLFEAMKRAGLVNDKEATPAGWAFMGQINPRDTLEQQKTTPDKVRALVDEKLGKRAFKAASAQDTWNDGNRAQRAALLTEIGRPELADSHADQSFSKLSANLQASLRAKMGEAAPKADAKPVTPQVPSSPARRSTPEELKAKADLQAALADLSMLVTKPGRMNILPEEEAKLMPILTRVFDAALRLGYVKFKQAAKFVLDTIREQLGSEVADQLTIDHLQGAYIGMAGKYREQGAETAKQVVSVESKDEIEAYQPEESSDVPGSDSSVEPGGSEPADQPDVGPDVPGADARGAQGAAGREGQGAGDARVRGEGDSRLPADGPALVGERGDQLHPGGRQPAGPSSGPAGSLFPGRGLLDRDTGVQPEPIAGNPAAGSAARNAADKRERQRAASAVAITPGDRDNIDASLPYLSEGQRQDVHTAETRFAKPDGYGMLFTNGTGTGKTFLGLGIASRFVRQGKANILIVVPDEKIAQDWIDSGRALDLKLSPLADTKSAGEGAVITTYANLGQNDALASRKWDLIIPDEAHTLMQDKDGTVTSYLQKLRAIAGHVDGIQTRVRMLHGDLFTRMDDALARIAAEKLVSTKAAALLDPINKAMDAAKAQVRQDVLSNQGAKRTRLAFLSATPFAYHKTLDWANGFLFDYNEGYPHQAEGTRAYNQPSPREHFYVSHLGYRMRYNKLTSPDAKVDVGLMERQLNSWMKRQGVLSSRLLDVPADYDRRFVLIDSAIGNKIDEAIEHLRERSWDREDPMGPAWDALRNAIDGSFDYLSRRYLLEAIKAREAVEVVQQHLALNRKVVVFHDYKKGGSSNPFDVAPTAPEGVDPQHLRQVAAEFRAAFPELYGPELTGLQSPIDVFQQAFGEQLLLINGDEKKSALLARYKMLQDDNVGPVVALVQSAKNKGWSGHDTTGKHQRVLLNLGQPTQPTLAIQQEGRIYRTGNVSDAIFRYFNTGTNWERWAFATTIAQRASTAENLAMGEQARALKDAFIAGFEESAAYPPGHEGEGKGGKERDRLAQQALSEYDRAKSFYYGTQKKTSKTKAQEGTDYFATPEPVGLKMAQWASVHAGESVLEPSAGHGAIARWFPELANRTAIEPSSNLRSRLAMVFDGKIVEGQFEAHDTAANKYDAVVMNPPFGLGGKTAIEHVAKAARHLREGRRLVALIPTGPAADKRLDAFLYGKEDRPAQPIGESSRAGKLYVGDVVQLDAGPGRYRITGRAQGSAGLILFQRVDANGGIPEGYRTHYVSKVLEKGDRTEQVSPSEGLNLIADVKLPAVTFERAGTQVATHIIVLHKGATTAAQVNRDYSGIDNINDLFDRLEDLNLARRAEPEEAAATGAVSTSAPATAAVPQRDPAPGQTVTPQASEPVIEHVTQKGKTIRGIVRMGLSRDEAQKIDPYTFKKDGGWFIREKYIENAKTEGGTPDTERPAFRMSEPTLRALPRATIDRTVSELTRDWLRKPQIHVIDSLEEGPPIVAKTAEQQRLQGGGDVDSVHGFHYRGEIYIMAPQMHSIEDVREVLFHEALGHFGLRGVFGDRLNPILDELVAMRPQLVAAKARDYGLDLKIDAQRRMAAEEVLAELAQTRPQIGWVRRAIGLIRGWLREHGLGRLVVSDDEILARYILPARGFVERGRSALPTIQAPASAEGAFSKGLDRRSFIVGTAAALAANPASAEATLGRAKALPTSVMSQRLPAPVEKLLVGNGHGTTNLQGATAMREALGIIARTGPQEVRALAAEIGKLLPADGISVQVDKGNWSVHGAVEFTPLVRLRLFDGTRSQGMTFDTFLHESLHAAVAARYQALSVGMLRSNDAKMGMSAPAAAQAMVQFRAVWGEFKDVALRSLPREGDAAGAALRLSMQEALGNPDEFFVRALTEPHLQAWMATQAYKGQTLWERFKGWVKSSLLGLREEGQKASWLDAALAASDDLLKAMAGDKPDFSRLNAISRTLHPGVEQRSVVDSPDVAFSKVLGNISARAYTPEQERAMRATGLQVDPKTVMDTLKQLRANGWKTLYQGVVDQFAPIKDLSRDAYALLRLSKGSAGAFETFLNGGQLKLTGDVYDFDDSKRGGVIQRLFTPLQGEHHDFMRWVAANRAEQLASQGRERLFSAQDIADLKTLAQGQLGFDFTLQHGPRAGQTTRSRAEAYADSLRTFNEFHKNTLDMAEQSGLIDGASRALWEGEFYVPFYREFEETGVAGANIKSGVVRQRAFQKLKGGEQKLHADLLENTLANWAHLLDAGAKNRAAKATLEAMLATGNAVEADQATVAQMSKSAGKLNGTVWFMDGGLQRHFFVDDPHLMAAISALSFAGMNSPVMKALGGFKHALTVGVTASPFFKIRNLIRDSVQAIASAPLSANPGKNLAEGWKATNPKADSYFRLLAGGGTIHFGTMYEGSEAKRVQALIEAGIDASTILNSQAKVQAFWRKIEHAVSAYQELGNRGEAVNRAALYQQLRRQGATHADASLQARDLLDFSMQGSFATIRFLTQVVPFMNARIQGLAKLGRAAKEDPARFAAVLGAVALLSVGLAAGYGDDDDWKKREDWDRNNYWWFKFGGTAFRIPKPFEIGAMGTLAERGYELWSSPEMTGTRFRDNVLALLSDNLAFNPIPQLVKPMVDVYANTDSFTGRPIESLGMERLQSAYRYNDRTTMAARGASTALNAVAGVVGKEALSPVQIDHLVQGYFGWLGSFVVSAGDVLARPATGQPTQATPDYWRSLSGGMVGQLEGAQSRYVSQMYQQAKTVEQAYGTWRELIRERKVEEAEIFRQEHAPELAAYHRVEQVKRGEAFLNQQRKRVEQDQSLTPEAKRERLLRIQQQQDTIARSVATGVRP